MSWERAGLTDVGRVRGHNEDAFLIASELNLLVLADGMGGHAAGEVASALAVEEVEAYFRVLDPNESSPSIPRSLEQALGAANGRIKAEARTNDRFGMGTTGVVALLSHARATIAWVGDSRAYQLRAGRLEQISTDHSLLNELLRLGRLSPADAPYFEHSNVITRALGSEEATPDYVEATFQNDDILLLCSDGLSDLLTDEQIGEILARTHALDAAAQALIDAANAEGGDDNITVVLARWRED